MKMGKTFNLAAMLLIFVAVMLYGCGGQEPERSNQAPLEVSEYEAVAINAPEQQDQQNQPEMPESLKILAVGNSFSKDAMHFLWEISNDSGFEEVILGNLFIGSADIQRHMVNANGNLKNYQYQKNTNGNMVLTDDTSILEAILDEEWDVILTQQVSGKSGVAQSYDLYLDRFIDYIKTHATNDKVRIGWHMTWAYAEDSTHNAFNTYDNDQLKMYDAIRNAVKEKIVPNEKIDFIFPSGTAVQNARTSFYGDRLDRDGYHLNDVGRYLVGLLWFKTLTDYPIDDIAYVPSGVSRKLVPMLKEAVNHAYANPFEITDSSFKEEAE